jgi:hypothetical protein
MAKREPEPDPGLAARNQKLNVLFALSSIGLLVTVGLMVWADYSREWRQYQVEFNRLKVELTQAQIEEALSPDDAERLSEIEAELARGREEAAQHRDEIVEVEAEVNRLQAEWYATDQDFRFTKAKLDVTRYELDEAVHSGHSSAEARRTHLQELEARWEAYRLEVEDIATQRDEKEARLAELRKTELAAEKARDELLSEKTRLEGLLGSIEPGFTNFVRNLPVLDLANPSLKINQIMPANLYDDVIFTPTPKVDRCMTCHLGIDQKGYEDAPQPYTTHPEPELYVKGPHAVDKVGCTVCHQGRGRGTTFVTAAATRPVPQRNGGGAEGLRAERRYRAGRTLRLLRLPQDQGLGDAAESGAGPEQGRLEDPRGVHVPLGQGAPGPAAHTDAAVLGRPDRRDPGAPTPQQRRGQRGGRVPRGGIGGGELPTSAHGRPRRGA